MAAWASHRDYAVLREKLKQAKALQAEIAETAKSLAEKLTKLNQIHDLAHPIELWSIPDLLRRTENECDHQWQQAKALVLGDPSAYEVESETDTRYRKALQSAWNNAPTTADLIESIAKLTADADILNKFPFNGVLTRQYTKSLDFFRVLASHMDKFGIEITPDTKTVLQHTVNVLIDDPDDELTDKRVSDTFPAKWKPSKLTQKK